MKKRMAGMLALVMAALLMCPEALGEQLRIYDQSTFIAENRRVQLYLSDVSLFWDQEEVRLDRNETLPVYSYPSEDGWRGAGDRAAVSLKEPFTALAFSEDNQWVLIEYQASKGRRIGYIRRPEGVQIAVNPLFPLHIPLTLNRDFTVTDDPDDSIRTIASLKEGDTVDVLGYTNNVWAYVEVTIQGRPARGFLPMAALSAPEEKEIPEIMAALQGVWRFTGGGELLGDGAIFDGEGGVQICASADDEQFPPQALVIYSDALPCEYSVYENRLGEKRYNPGSYVLEIRSPEGGLDRFGLEWDIQDRESQAGETSFLAYQVEGGGGFYERMDDMPILYREAEEE